MTSSVTPHTLAAPAARKPAFPAPRWAWAGAALLFIGLIGLDRLTFVTPIYIQVVTPWNPVLGVCVAVALLYRWGGAVVAFAAATTCSLLAPDGPRPVTLAVLDGIVTAAQTAAIVDLAGLLARRSTQDLLKNPLVGALLAAPLVTLLAGAVYVPTIAALGIVQPAHMGSHFVRFAVGSVIGVLIFAPLFAIRLAPGPKEPLTTGRLLEACAQGALVLAAVWVAFGEYPETASRYLFVVFLPMIWIVLRFGVRGAIVLNALVQASMIASLVFAGHLEANVTLFQALLLVLTASGFVFGLAVDQSKLATLRLRTREEELAASLRVAATGELAGTLAHELGHPLGAISNYASALNHVLRRIAPNNTEAAAIGAKLTQEVVRATDTLHRMRDFFRTGGMTVEPADLGEIVKDAALLLKDRLGRNAISPYIVVQGGSNIVLGDQVQLRAVVYNLLVNAIDALKPVPLESRALAVMVRRANESVILEVDDSGRGVANDVRDDIFEPLVTTKKDGLGLGLSMSRSVIHAHGGTIILSDSKLGGARFVVTLPAEY
ncbi:MAG: MASE1 domain-containing protein [Rhodospirillaceae bacterium]|nr:MASE1 domain-containing protein [Rhodospirillaceae bacterium]